MHQRRRDIGWMSQSRMPLPARCAEEVADRPPEFCGDGSQCRKASQIALTLELVFAKSQRRKTASSPIWFPASGHNENLKPPAVFRAHGGQSISQLR